MNPFTCPVCQGRGEVVPVFGATMMVACHPCGGSGLVWGPPGSVAIPSVWIGTGTLPGYRTTTISPLLPENT